MSDSRKRGAMRNALGLATALLLVVGMASCSSDAEPDSAISVSTTTPVETSTSGGGSSTEAVSWVFPDGWWRVPQVWAVQPQDEWDTASTLAAFDFPGYEAVSASVVSWFEGSKVAVDELHSRGLTVVGQDGQIRMFQPDRTNPELFWDEEAQIFDFGVDDPPDFAVAALIDPFGNPMYTEMFGFSDGVQYLQYSVPHPAWQEYMTQHMKNLIDAGVDGYLIDELAYGTVGYPDFGAHTLQEFNRFLGEQFEPADLQALLESVGVDDLTSFDYAAVVREQLPADATALSMEVWGEWDFLSALPLFTVYRRFQALQNYEAAAALIETGRQYARETAGKEIPFSANINNLVAPDNFLIVPLLDMIDLEFFYADFGYFRNGRGIAPLKLTRYFDKPAVMRTSVSAEGDIAAWGAAGTVDLFGTMIADAVSSGGEFYVEGSVEQDVAALTPFYRFRGDNPGLFDGLQSLEPQVAVLLLWESVVEDPYRISAYLGSTSLLADAGTQFDTIFGAMEYRSEGEMPMYPAPDFPLDAEMLGSYPVLVLPELGDLTESHAATLVEYVDAGGVLVTYVADEFGLEFQRGADPAIAALLRMLRSGSETEAGGKVVRLDESLGRSYNDNPDPALRLEWIDLMAGLGFGPEIRYDAGPMLAAQAYAAEDRLVVHFVNYNWDIETLRTAPINDISVEIALPAGLDRESLTASLHFPGGVAVQLEVEQSEAGIIVTIPEIHIWSVVSVVAANG